MRPAKVSDQAPLPARTCALYLAQHLLALACSSEGRASNAAAAAFNLRLSAGWWGKVHSCSHAWKLSAVQQDTG